MHDDPVDLAPLDPSREASRWQRMIAAIVARAEPELARRAVAASGPLPLLAGWAAPALSAAAALAAVSLVTLALTRDPTSTEPGANDVVDSLIVEPASRWLAEERPPATSDLILALEEEIP